MSRPRGDMSFSTIVRNDDPIVRDHRVVGVRAVPGVTFIELLLRYLTSRGFPLDGIEIRDMVFLEPVVTSGRFDKVVEVQLTDVGTHWEVVARSTRVSRTGERDATYADNMRAEVYLSPSRLMGTIDVDALKTAADCTESIESCYRDARGAGVHHYDYMKLVGDVHRGQGSTLAKVSLGTAAEPDREQFCIHPAYLDGAVTVASTYMAESMRGGNERAVPAFVGSFRAVRAPEHGCYVYVERRTYQETPGSDVTYVDVNICDPAGEVIAQYGRFGLLKYRSEGAIRGLAEVDVEPRSAEETSVAPEPAPAVGPVFASDPSRAPASASTALSASGGGVELMLQQMLGTALGKPAESISVTGGFYEQGLDSKDLLGLVGDLERLIGERLYPTLLFEYTSISRLAAYLETEHTAAVTSITSGQPLEVQLHAIAPVAVEATAAALRDATDDHGLHFTPQWRARPLVQTPRMPSTAGTERTGACLVVTPAGFGGLERRLINAFDPERVLRIGLGRYTSRGASGRWKVALDDPAAMARVIDDMVAGGAHITELLFLGGLVDPKTSCERIRDLSLLQEQGVISLFRIIKALESAGALGELERVTVVTNEAHGVLPTDRVVPFAASLQGFAKSFAREFRGMRVSVVDIGNDHETTEVARAIADEPAQTEGEDVALREGVRFVRTLAPADSHGAGGCSFKEGGVYAILGGASGIGLEVARYLAGRYQARVAIVGRRPQGDLSHEVLDSIETAGGEAFYVSADAADNTAMHEAARLIRERFGVIDGAIHSAVALDDRVLANMDEAQLRAVLAPKVAGAATFTEAFHADGLGFMVFFSSVQSFYGNIGQANYAAGCTFEDAWAARLDAMRPYPVKTMNWGYWANVGVGATPEHAQMLAAQGLGSLTTDEGMEALERLLGGESRSLVTVRAEVDALRGIRVEFGGAEATTGEGDGPVAGSAAARAADSVVPASERVTSPAPASESASAPRPSRASRAEDEPIAIVGMSGRYPMARNLGEFWANLLCARDCITEVPPERWDWRRYHSDVRGANGKSYNHWGGFIDDVDMFDPLFFNISPRDAELIDPQERLFLQTAFEALENAGCTRAELAKAPVGVFVGVMWGQYQYQSLDGPPANSLFGSVANRVSYWFDFTGPSLAIDSLCSSSLTAVHYACESIHRGECEAALAGGVNLSIHPAKYTLLSGLDLVASNGSTKSFRVGGDGYIPGEGVGAVLLKPLSVALRDGDTVHALIRGSSVNHGGRTSGYAVPSPAAQARLIVSALERAGVEPADVSYVEAAATGSSLGDAIEVAGLTKAFGKAGHRSERCAIGSVKGSIGHLEAASGISQLTKAVLQMKHHTLVPQVGVEPVNPDIDFERSPFRIVTEPTGWVSEDGQSLRAAVSSFGAGGSNAHVVLEEYRAEHRTSTAEAGLVALPFSALNAERLSELLERMQGAITDSGGPKLADIAYTLQVGREALEQRVVVIASSREEAGALIARARREVDGAQRVFSSASSLRRGDGAERAELMAVAGAWAGGAEVDWRAVSACPVGRKVELPTYPFERRRCWLEPAMDAVVQADVERAEPADDAVVGRLTEMVGSLLKLGAHELDVSRDLRAYGFNSLSAMRLVNRVSEYYGVAVPVQPLLKLNTIGELAGHLVASGLTGPASAPAAAGEAVPGGGQYGSSRDLTLEQILTLVAEGRVTPEQAVILESAVRPEQLS